MALIRGGGRIAGGNGLSGLPYNGYGAGGIRPGGGGVPTSQTQPRPMAAEQKTSMGTGMGLAGPAPSSGYSSGPALPPAMQQSQLDHNRQAGLPDNYNPWGGAPPKPVGVVDGNQVYRYGLQNSNGTGNQTILADPSQTTYFSGHTAPVGFTLGNSGAGALGGVARGTPAPQGGVGGAIRAGGGIGGFGGLPYGGIGAGGAGSAIGQQLQNDLNAANAANEARYQQALGVNQTGAANQQAALDQNYGNIQNTITGNQAQQMGFMGSNLANQQALISGLGTTQHTQETQRLNKQLGASSQSLTGRGLGNSTVVDSMAKGYQQASAQNQQAIDDALNQQQLGVLGQYGAMGQAALASTGQQMVGAQTGYANANQGQLAQNQAQQIGIIESKTDQGPNIQAYINALSQAGAQGGYGTGGIGGIGGANGGNRAPVGFSLGGRNGNGGGGGQGSLLQQYIQSLLGGANGGGTIGSQSVNDANYGLGGNLPQNQNGLPTAAQIADQYGFSQPQSAAQMRQTLGAQGWDTRGWSDQDLLGINMNDLANSGLQRYSAGGGGTNMAGDQTYVDGEQDMTGQLSPLDNQWWPSGYGSNP